MMVKAEHAFATLKETIARLPGRKPDAATQYSVRLKDLIKRGDISANVEMKPGDILIIPQSFL